MNLWLLLRFLLLLSGLTYLLTRSAIFLPVRTLPLPCFFTVGLYCPACAGFWLGGALAALGYWPFPATFTWSAPLEAAVCSVALMHAWGEHFFDNSVWAREQEPAPESVEVVRDHLSGAHDRTESH